MRFFTRICGGGRKLDETSVLSVILLQDNIYLLLESNMWCYLIRIEFFPKYLSKNMI